MPNIKKLILSSASVPFFYRFYLFLMSVHEFFACIHGFIPAVLVEARRGHQSPSNGHNRCLCWVLDVWALETNPDPLYEQVLLTAAPPPHTLLLFLTVGPWENKFLWVSISSPKGWSRVSIVLLSLGTYYNLSCIFSLNSLFPSNLNHIS